MTTFAPNFTPRWKGKYLAGGIQHTLTLRGARGTTAFLMDEFRHVAESMFEELVLKLADDYAWIEASIALTDSDVFLPSTTPTPISPGTVDFTALAPRQKIRGLTFSGRSGDGRARFTLFGLDYQDIGVAAIGGNGIITPTEDASIGTVVLLANDNVFSAGGLPAVFHNQATYKENDHLLKLVRRGTIS